MTYQTTNEIKAANKSYAAKTNQYDENGNYIRRTNWKGMKWITNQRRLAVYLRDNLQCCYCGKTMLNGAKLTLDHVIPIAEYSGKMTDATNLVTCCTNCNYRKQDISLQTFAKIIGAEKGINPILIVNHVKRSLLKELDIKQAGRIVRAQKNWTNIFKNIKL